MSDKKQWSWESQKSWVANKKNTKQTTKNSRATNDTMRNPKGMSSLAKKWVAYLKNEQEIKTWETQKSWAAFMKKKQLMSNKWQHEKLKRHE